MWSKEIITPTEAFCPNSRTELTEVRMAVTSPEPSLSVSSAIGGRRLRKDSAKPTAASRAGRPQKSTSAPSVSQARACGCGPRRDRRFADFLWAVLAVSRLGFSFRISSIQSGAKRSSSLIHIQNGSAHVHYKRHDGRLSRLDRVRCSCINPRSSYGIVYAGSTSVR